MKMYVVSTVIRHSVAIRSVKVERATANSVWYDGGRKKRSGGTWTFFEDLDSARLHAMSELGRIKKELDSAMARYSKSVDAVDDYRGE